MANITNRTSPVQEIGALMAQYNIPCTKVSGDITNVHQAIQYVHQKMKASSKWSTINVVNTAVITGAIAFGVGMATAGVGAAAVGAAIGTGAGTVSGLTFDKLGGFGATKCMRGMKALYKKARGTKGKHRREAADVLVTYASRVCFTNSQSDSLGNLAYWTLEAMIGNTRLRPLLQDVEGAKVTVAEMLRS